MKEEGISIFLKKTKDFPVKSFKGTMKTKSRLSSIVALLDDTDVYPRFLHNCKSATNVKQLSSNETYKYIVTSMPWPVVNRDMVAHSVLTQNSQNKQIEIKLNAISGLVPLKNNMVRIKTMRGRWLITPLLNSVGDDTGEKLVEYEMNLDPAGKIPKWLVNTLVVEIPFNTLKNMRSLLRNEKYKKATLAHIVN